MLYSNKLYWMNNVNGADYFMLAVASMVRKKFKENLIGVEMGIAYGGGVEAVGRMWKGIGTVYGFDTFEGHPDHLADDPNSHEARCMDRWYNNTFEGKDRIPHLTKEMLTYDYQRAALDSQGLTNVILKKGLINKDSLAGIDHIHYALLDMDLIESMRTGIELVKDKIVKGGFLCLHDVIPEGHIPGLYDICEDLFLSGDWETVVWSKDAYMVVLKRKV